ncbi:PAS domain-containing protein [Vogesella sp. GCM10023246]|uniref:histidine kinase n=1 Tax=Vogesella oryzagri TaxID=3160864 RepID=A0ABV1M376_9NEIS
MRIKHHLLLWFVLGSLLPLLLVGGLAYQRFASHYRESTQAQLQALLTVRLNEIADWWQGQTTMMRLLSSDNDLDACVRAFSAQGVSTATTCTFVEEANIVIGQNDMLLLDPRGKVLFSPNHPAWRGLDLADPRQSSSRMAGQLQELITLPTSGVRFIPHAPFAPVKTYAAFWLSPVLQQDKLLGFLLIRVNEEHLQHITGNYAGMGADGENLLVTTQERGEAMVIAPLRRTPNAAFRLKITPQMQAGQAMWEALDGGVGVGRSLDYQGRPVLAAWSALPLLGGAIMVTRDEAAVMAPLQQQRNQLIGILLVVAVFACAITFWRARKLVVPINTLLQASQRISRGEPGVRLPPLDGREFQSLGNTFNAMAEQLERSQLQRQLQLEDAERMAKLGYFIANSDGRPDEWTEQLYHILEYPTEQPPQISSFLQRIHPDDLQNVLLAHAANLQHGYEVDFRLQMPDGRIKYLREVGRHEFDSSGQPLRRVAVVQDVTVAWQLAHEMDAAREALEQERLARAEEAASNAEAKAQAILQTMGEGVLGLAADGRVVFCNPAAAMMLGASSEALNGRQLDDFLYHYNAYGLRLVPPSPLLRALQQGLPCSSHREQFGSAQRERFPVFYQLNMLARPIGELGAVLLFRDITLQRANEMRLEQMSRAVTQSPAGVMITDPQGLIEFVNPRLLQMSGYDEQELLGQRPGLLKSGKTGPQVYAELWRALLSGESWHGELLNRRKDGREYWVMQMVSPVRDAAGCITHYVSVQEDITAQKQLAQRMQEAVAAAENATEAKSAFLANMSHEIRTPMNAIIGMTDLVMREQLPAKARDYLGKVVRSARGLLEIINDILDFSKIESGYLQIEQSPFLLEEVLAPLADILAMRLDGKSLELVFDVAPDVPSRWQGDALRLGQVLLNLLGNAVKFTTTGYVLLTVRWQGGVLHFEVQDSGIGMSEAQLARLFQPFSQADASTQRRYGGSGLGLVISNQLVQLMGGEQIRIDSQPGKGSCFAFSLPLPALAVAAAAPWQPEGKLFHARLSEQYRGCLLPLCQRLGMESSEIVTRTQLLALLAAWRTEDVLLLDSDAADWRELVRDIPWPANAKLILLSRHHVSSGALLPVASRSLPVCEVWLKPLTIGRFYQGMQRLGQAIPAADEAANNTLPRLDGCHVLVVDDVPLNQEVAAAYLQEAGASVCFAANGAEALQALQQGLPDAVLMDCHMPVMDGFVATQQIRANPAWQALKIIALTANALSGSREEVLAAGMDDYISKPIDPVRLFAVLAQAGLQARPASAAHVATPPAAVAGPELAAAPADEWQQLAAAGVNVEDGTARAVGMQHVYRKWLLLFASNMASFADDSQAALQAGDGELLLRLVHTLRGAAGNVSADEVARQAGEIEQAIRQGAAVATLAPQLAALLQQLAAVRQAVAALAQTAA